MKILRIILINTVDFYTRGTSQGSTTDFLRNSEGYPYIPATHIKGVMRTEAERIMRSRMDYKYEPLKFESDTDVSDAEEERRKKIRTEEELKIREVSPDVCNLFGKRHGENSEVYHEGKIKLTDFIADKKVMSVPRMHVAIDREKLSKKGKSLFRILAVPGGSRFTGYLFMLNLTEDENKLLMASLHSMCHYGLGGERSRGMGDFKIEECSSISYEEFIKGGVFL
jgi:CRISPR/Cas system CSM-associated protein Csm3 (group 7 of RAMP superfamily)